LIFGFRESFDFDVFVEFGFRKGILKEFEVVDELPLIFGFPGYFGHVDTVRKETVHNSTVDCSSTQLFDFFKIKLEWNK